MDPLAYWIAFNRVRGIGPARLRALLDAFDTIENAWHAPAAKLREAGLDRRSLANMLEARSSLDLAAELKRLRACRRAGPDLGGCGLPRAPAQYH